MIAAGGAAPSRLPRRTILIVDDDRSVADTFARMLKLEGFGVATALSAEAGLDAASVTPRRHHPRHADADHQRPPVPAAVRAEPHLADVPVAIVTGDYFLAEPIQHELQLARRVDPLQAALARRSGRAGEDPRSHA